jgi:hypothetical protein
VSKMFLTKPNSIVKMPRGSSGIKPSFRDNSMATSSVREVSKSPDFLGTFSPIRLALLFFGIGIELTRTNEKSALKGRILEVVNSSILRRIVTVLAATFMLFPVLHEFYIQYDTLILTQNAFDIFRSLEHARYLVERLEVTLIFFIILFRVKKINQLLKECNEAIFSLLSPNQRRFLKHQMRKMVFCIIAVVTVLYLIPQTYIRVQKIKSLLGKNTKNVSSTAKSDWYSDFAANNVIFFDFFLTHCIRTYGTIGLVVIMTLVCLTQFALIRLVKQLSNKAESLSDSMKLSCQTKEAYPMEKSQTKSYSKPLICSGDLISFREERRIVVGLFKLFNEAFSAVLLIFLVTKVIALLSSFAWVFSPQVFFISADHTTGIVLSLIFSVARTSIVVALCIHSTEKVS